jgi:hypothetical protein
MKIKRQTRNIMKRPDIFGNSNAVFRVPLQKLAIFLRCKERDEGKGKRETKGTATPLENPSQASQDYLSDGTPDWCHSAGMMVAGKYVNQSSWWRRFCLGCLLFMYLKSPFILKTIGHFSLTVGAGSGSHSVA